MSMEYENDYARMEEIRDNFLAGVQGSLPAGAEITEWEGFVYIGFHPDTTSQEIYDTLQRTKQLWEQNIPDEFANDEEFSAIPTGYIMDDDYMDNVGLWPEDGNLATMLGDTIVLEDKPIDKEYLGENTTRQMQAFEAAEKIRNMDAVNMLKEIGISEPEHDQIVYARLYIDNDRWGQDLIRHVLELAFDPNTDRTSNLYAAEIYTYMDILEASGRTHSGATTWDEFITDARQSVTYRPGFGGDFPPIRNMPSFDDARDIPSRHPIDEIDLPTISGGSSLAPDLDDLRSEIDRFKEDRPRTNKEEYRGGTGQGPGYRQRRGRGRIN